MSETKFKYGAHMLSLDELEAALKVYPHVSNQLIHELIDEIKSLRSAQSDEVIGEKTPFEESFKKKYKLSANKVDVQDHPEFTQLPWCGDHFVDGGARVGRVYTTFEDKTQADHFRERLKVLGLPYTSNWPQED